MIMKKETLVAGQAPSHLGRRLPAELRDADAKTLGQGTVALPLSGTKAVFYPASGADDEGILHRATTLFLITGEHPLKISRLRRSGEVEDPHYVLTLPAQKRYHEFMRYENSTRDLRIAFEMISTRIERAWRTPKDIVEIKILQESANGASVFKIVALLKPHSKSKESASTDILDEVDLSEDFKEEHDAERAMRLGFPVLPQPEVRALANELIASRHAILCEP